MANSVSPGVAGAKKSHKHVRGSIPARSPGATGHNDAGDPNHLASLGDTEGPLGHKDHGSPIPENEYIIGRLFSVYTGHRYPAGEKPDVLKKAGDFVLKEEVNPQVPAGARYNPCWPGGQSGVTWGVGWDARWCTADEVKNTWAELDKEDLDKLANTAQKQGAPDAQEALKDVKAIVIPEDVAMKVFKKDVEVCYELTGKTFPGFEKLPTGVQVALISLVYNRKQNKKMPMTGNRKWEMRRIQKAVVVRNLVWIYDELGNMLRVWKGTKIEDMMNKRRSHERQLIKPYILADLESAARESWGL